MGSMLHASLNASGLRQRVMFVVKNILIYYQAITYGCLKKIQNDWDVDYH